MTTLNINPSILTWAIERAGVELDTILSKFPNLQKWIEQQKSPTFKQLEDFSHRIHIPFGYFFLDTPPTIELPFPFFRTDGSSQKYISLEIFDAVSILQQRQEWLKEYLLSMEVSPLPFVGKYQAKPVEDVVASIREALKLPEEWAMEFSSWEQALDGLTKKVENSGIIVTFNGVVGNNTHRKIKVEDCRGFVLTDEIVPFMFVNNADSKSAQMFTIAHELAHIWIGSSAGFDFRQLLPADDETEKFCDKVAAELLVPKKLFNKHWKNFDFKQLARHFKVSELVIARRALDTGKIDKKEFFEFYNQYIQKESALKSSGGGGDFYLTARKRVSLKFASYINMAIQSGDILHRDAYKLTGLHGGIFYKFLSDNFG
ncbi:MAG: ImmA/IrrE family metallo-endopeptidase [Neisseriales bacterium]|nr:MAG: ImmA/IrrE family metallo-endopeptidase [Neisseriales bacterium]